MTSEEERNLRQDRKLTRSEIILLQKAGIDIHEYKDDDHTGQRDLYKDRQGNIYVKSKEVQGFGEETGLNINDFY